MKKTIIALTIATATAAASMAAHAEQSSSNDSSSSSSSSAIQRAINRLADATGITALQKPQMQSDSVLKEAGAHDDVVVRAVQAMSASCLREGGVVTYPGGATQQFGLTVDYVNCTTDGKTMRMQVMSTDGKQVLQRVEFDDRDAASKAAREVRQVLGGASGLLSVDVDLAAVVLRYKPEPQAVASAKQ